VKTFFEHPSLFTFAIFALRKAAVVEIPLEALADVVQSLMLLQEMFMLEVGEAPTQEELVHLFNYVLLTSKIPNLFSLAKYLEQYLVDLQQAEVPLLDDWMRGGLAQFVKHTAMLDQLMSDY
jgi:hypothetical protein